jgi:hypothetical protein
VLFAVVALWKGNGLSSEDVLVVEDWTADDDAAAVAAMEGSAWDRLEDELMVEDWSSNDEDAAAAAATEEVAWDWHEAALAVWPVESGCCGVIPG